MAEKRQKKARMICLGVQMHIHHNGQPSVSIIGKTLNFFINSFNMSVIAWNEDTK